MKINKSAREIVSLLKMVYRKHAMKESSILSGTGNSRRARRCA